MTQNTHITVTLTSELRLEQALKDAGVKDLTIGNRDWTSRILSLYRSNIG